MKKFTDSVLDAERKDEGTTHLGRQISEEEDIQMVVGRLFTEYKQFIETKNLERACRTLKKIEDLKPETPLLNLMRGEIHLFTGDGDRSFEELLCYIMKVQTPDGYGMNVIGRWNLASGNPSDALSQFCESLQDRQSLRQKIITLLSAARCKKGLQFLDTALNYYTRILVIPEGYMMLPYVMLEMIHLHILKKNFSEAKSMISWYSKRNSNTLLVRLTAFLDYLTNHVDDIIESSYDKNIDPYIAYLVARVAIEKRVGRIDWDSFIMKALKTSNENPYIYVTRGNAFYSEGDLEAAIENYDQALSINPSLEHARNNRENVHKEIITGQRAILVDIEPDPDLLDFFYTFELLGYFPFKLKRVPLKKLHIMKTPGSGFR